VPFGEVIIPGAQQLSRLVERQNGGITLMERDNRSVSRNYHASMGPPILASAVSGICAQPSINLRPTANVHIPLLQTTIDCESREAAWFDNHIRPLRQIARVL